MSKQFGKYLESVGCNGELVQKIIDYRLGSPKSQSNRLVDPNLVREFEDTKSRGVVVQAITAILAGKHVIFEGVKGTGKNTLINLLSYIFGRPVYTHSFNKFSDVDSIVGSNTLVQGNIEFKPHQLTEALQDSDGAWFVADEINMARGDTLAFLHELLDDRGEIEIPSVGKIKKNTHFRFIGTMNYGYTGTQELNEAFADRFVVIHIEPLSKEELSKMLVTDYPELNVDYANKFARLYHDCHNLAHEGQISSRGVTVRGIKSAIDLIINYDLNWELAIRMSILNKTFDEYEKEKIEDIIRTLIPFDTNHDFKRPSMDGTSSVDISEVESL